MNYTFKKYLIFYASLLLLSNSLSANGKESADQQNSSVFEEAYDQGKKAFDDQNYDHCIELSLTALAEAESIKDYNGIFRANALLGKAYQAKNDYTNAVFHYSQILDYKEDAITPKRKAAVARKLGEIYKKVGNYEKAYRSYYDALQISESLKDTNGIKSAFYNIGQLEFYQKNYPQSIDWYEKILDLIAPNPKSYQYLTILVAMASSYEEMRQFETAITYNTQVIELIAGNKDLKTLEAYAQQNLGTTYLKLKNTTLAESFLRAALDNFQAIADESGMIKARKFLAQLYLEIQENRSAIAELNTALPLCRKLKEHPQLLEILSLLAEGYEKIGDSKTSLKFLKEYKILSDSIKNQEKLKAIEFTKISYDIDKQNQEIAYLKKNKELLEKDKQLAERTNVFFIIVLALLVAFLVWVTYTYRVKASLNKQLEEKNHFIEQQNQQLEEFNQDLQQFAYVASHDLKSPMRTIKSFSTLLKKKFNKEIPEEGKVYLKYMEDAISKMQELLEETLLFAKSRKQNNIPISSVAVRPVINDCLFNLQSDIKDNNVIIHIQNTEFPKVECNKTQLLQVFQNLISNAIKFKGEEQPSIRLSCTVDGLYAKFSIKDNGIGIPKETQSMIFEMFSRGENINGQEGTGIGLATCKKIINHFGGKIWVESSEKGSNFFFTLPIAQEDLYKFNKKSQQTVAYLKR